MAKAKAFLVVAAIAVSALAFSVGVFAAPGNGKKIGQGDTRPGYGYGDTNHVHTGPPGQQP
jgi:hypothetical protein